MSSESASWTAELRALEHRELAHTLRTLGRGRVAITVGLLGWGIVFAILEPGFVRAAAMFILAAAFGGIFVLDARRHGEHTEWRPGTIIYYLITILTFHTALIVATGGIASPFIVLYVPVTVLAAFALGEPRHFITVAAIPFSIVWLLAIGLLTGLLPDLLPTFLGGGAARSVAFVIIYAAVVSLTAVLGGTLGLVLRGALMRAAGAAASARQEALMSMRERNHELIELSGTIAHELKNPLASIQGLASLLARKLPAGSREAEQMGVLLGEAHRMGGILDELLNFSRPATGLALRDADVRALVEDVVALHEGVASERRIVVRADVEGVERLRADPRKLKQVLVNLLQNAIDATPAGRRVTVRARPAGDGGTVLEVEDEGSGLDESVRGRLFRAGATSKPEGSGLGLVIARAITEQHGGVLELAERPEGGVRATCRLPARPPAGASAGAPDATRGGER